MRIASILFLVILLCSTVQGFGQRIGYVDTEYILAQLPDYKAAQEEIERQSKRWQEQLDGLYAEIEDLYRKYREEEVLLSEAIKQQRQDEILEKEKAAKEFQRKYFGYEGELFKQREEKVKPVQERVFKAVEELAAEKKLDFIFDRAGDVTLLYANPGYDYSKLVLEKLGIR
ncbi:MAG: OmpH family outer membrane protein [Bacteroidia bacterium]|nr:OmpH family outer membrane protein [Bacteroidia bacterium]